MTLKRTHASGLAMKKIEWRRSGALAQSSPSGLLTNEVVGVSLR